MTRCESPRDIPPWWNDRRQRVSRRVSSRQWYIHADQARGRRMLRRGRRHWRTRCELHSLLCVQYLRCFDTKQIVPPFEAFHMYLTVVPFRGLRMTETVEVACCQCENVCGIGHIFTLNEWICHSGRARGDGAQLLPLLRQLNTVEDENWWCITRMNHNKVVCVCQVDCCVRDLSLIHI